MINRGEWVRVVPAGEFLGLVCWRCHGIARILLPISLSELPPLMGCFGDRHLACKPTLYGERRELTRLLRWRARLERDGDTRIVETPGGALPWAYETLSDFEKR